MSDPEESNVHLPTDPNPEQVVAALTYAFQMGTGDAQYQSLISTAVPGISPTYGIRVPALREMAKEILRKYKNQTAALRDLAQESWSTGTREHKLVALFIFDGLKDLAPQDRWAIGIRFLPDVGNWEECDQLCMAMFGRVIIESPSVMDELERWVQDPNFWVRRAALVTTVYLRNGKFDDERHLCDPLVEKCEWGGGGVFMVMHSNEHLESDHNSGWQVDAKREESLSYVADDVSSFLRNASWFCSLNFFEANFSVERPELVSPGFDCSIIHLYAS